MDKRFKLTIPTRLHHAQACTSSPAPVVDLTSDSGESQPELGYLLEASDDELGLPPSGNSLGYSHHHKHDDEIENPIEDSAKTPRKAIPKK
jgi:hypothetical protein